MQDEQPLCSASGSGMAKRVGISLARFRRDGSQKTFVYPLRCGGTTDMNIFVKSRGYNRQEDYQWHHVAAEHEEVIDTLVPAPYEQYGLGRMIWAEDESYVLGRFGDA